MSFQKEQIHDMYLLSPMQKGMLFHSLEEESSAYFVQIITSVDGELDVSLLLRSFEILLERHDILRTTFLYEDLVDPIQIVLKNRPADVFVEKVEVLAGQSLRDAAEPFIQKDKEKSFHITTDSLIRLSLIQDQKSECLIIISFHHIIMDGWCSDLLFNELFHIYNALKEGKDIQLQLPASYSQYINWLENQDKQQAAEYWQEYSQGYEQITDLPYLHPTRTTATYQAEEYTFSLGKKRTGELASLARQNQVTLSTLFHSLWGVILQKYNDLNDVMFGTVLNGRPSEINGVEHMIGLFINTVPVRIHSKENQSFELLLRQTHTHLAESTGYSYLPLTQIQNSCTTGKSLFDHIVVFNHYPTEKKWREDLLKSEITFNEQTVIEHTNYVMSITATLQENELLVQFIYNANSLKLENIKCFEQHILQVAHTVLANRSVLVREISLLHPEEIQTLLTSNHPVTPYPHHQTIADLFEQQVRDTPERTALVYEKESLTYLELNHKANQIANALRQNKVQPNQLVGLLAGRSFEMIIGIMGILKSNGAYVPLDPENPIQRLQMIISDVQPAIMIIQRSLLSQWQKIQHPNSTDNDITVYILEDLLQCPDRECYLNPERTCQSSDLGYVMYTSGSTGRPKGILTNQKSIVRVVKETNYIKITPEDAMLQLSNFAFDGSAFDIFGALLNGAKLVLLPAKWSLDMEKLLAVIHQENITIFFATTALFNAIVDSRLEILKSLKYILFGGERVSFQHVKKALAEVGKGKILHMYGPTESTIYATCHEIHTVDESLGTIPIGTPIANTGLLILDQYNQLQPIGVKGELCITGAGLAGGYMNNEKLTDEKFVPHPYFPEVSIYKTGDLARWLPDGSIEYIGRKDHQIKLRGFRIEPGEIEFHLLSHQAIKEAIVIEHLDEQKAEKLCAYYVTANHQPLEENDIKKYLSTRLPYYMIPVHYIHLESLPLNTNGKIDTSHLRTLEWKTTGTTSHMSPVDDLEGVLIKVWQEVLHVQNIGTTDNYYELGGDSIKAIQICARLRDQQLQLTVSDLLKMPVITDLKQLVYSVHSDNETETEEELYSGLSSDEFLDLEKELRAVMNQD